MANQLSLNRKAKRKADNAARPARTSVSPVPISSYQEAPAVDGSLFKFVMPAEGIIESAVIVIEELPKDGVEIQALVEQKGGGLSILLNVVKAKEPVGVVVAALLRVGDRITVRLTKPAEIKGIWIGFLWTPSAANVKLMELSNEGV